MFRILSFAISLSPLRTQAAAPAVAAGSSFPRFPARDGSVSGADGQPVTQRRSPTRRAEGWR